MPPTTAAAFVLGIGVGEVERHPATLDGGLQRDREVALARLEHVAGLVGPVLQLLDTGPGAALGVVEHLLERLGELLGAEALVQFEQPPPADPPGGQLGAQVGSALLGLAHLVRQFRDRVLVQDPR